MGPTALLPYWTKSNSWFLYFEKIHRPQPGLNPWTSDPEASMITTGSPGSTQEEEDNISGCFRRLSTPRAEDNGWFRRLSTLKSRWVWLEETLIYYTDWRYNLTFVLFHLPVLLRLLITKHFELNLYDYWLYYYYYYYYFIITPVNFDLSNILYMIQGWNKNWHIRETDVTFCILDISIFILILLTNAIFFIINLVFKVCFRFTNEAGVAVG